MINQWKHLLVSHITILSFNSFFTLSSIKRSSPPPALCWRDPEPWYATTGAARLSYTAAVKQQAPLPLQSDLTHASPVDSRYVVALWIESELSAIFVFVVIHAACESL